MHENEKKAINWWMILKIVILIGVVCVALPFALKAAEESMLPPVLSVSTSAKEMLLSYIRRVQGPKIKVTSVKPQTVMYLMGSSFESLSGAAWISLEEPCKSTLIICPQVCGKDERNSIIKRGAVAGIHVYITNAQSVFNGIDTVARELLETAPPTSLV